MDATWWEMAPEIHRQRLVVEGYPDMPVDESTALRYMLGLGGVLNMTILTDPVTHRSPRYGVAGWVHWEDSGAHLYAWEPPSSRLFLSVDIYTCKPFDPDDAVEYTRDFFHMSLVTAKEA